MAVHLNLTAKRCSSSLWGSLTLDTKFPQAGVDNGKAALKALGGLDLSKCAGDLNKILAKTGKTAADVGAAIQGATIADGSSAGGQAGQDFGSKAAVMAAVYAYSPTTIFIRSDVWQDTYGTWGGWFNATLAIPAYENKDGSPSLYADFTMLHEIMHVMGATDSDVAAGLGLTYDPNNTEPFNSALMQRCGY